MHEGQGHPGLKRRVKRGLRLDRPAWQETSSCAGCRACRPGEQFSSFWPMQHSHCPQGGISIEDSKARRSGKALGNSSGNCRRCCIGDLTGDKRAFTWAGELGGWQTAAARLSAKLASSSSSLNFHVPWRGRTGKRPRLTRLTGGGEVRGLSIRSGGGLSQRSKVDSSLSLLHHQKRGNSEGKIAWKRVYNHHVPHVSHVFNPSQSTSIADSEHVVIDFPAMEGNRVG